MTIHTRIRALREAKGWSRRQLGDEIQRLEGNNKAISSPTIRGWEEGEYAPKRTRLPYVAQALGTTVEALLADENFEGYRLSVADTADEDRPKYTASPAWPFKRIAPSEIAEMSTEALEQLERVMAAYLDLKLPVVHWRPVALRVASELDQHRGNDEFTTFVRAVDLELERDIAKLKTLKPGPIKARS
jgi:transcriptional regulator with XRE-family HTH domain